MGEIETAARVARDKLAAALSFLTPAQGFLPAAPSVPEARVLGALAVATGALYRLERSRPGAARSALQARDAIRWTLAALQDAAPNTPELDSILEQVAGCLGMTTQLVEILGGEPEQPRQAEAAVPNRPRKATPLGAQTAYGHAPPGDYHKTPPDQVAVPRASAAQVGLEPSSPPTAGSPGGLHHEVVAIQGSGSNPMDKAAREKASAPRGGSPLPREVEPPSRQPDLSSTRMSRQQASVRIPDSLDTTQASFIHENGTAPRGIKTPASVPRESDAQGPLFRSSEAARKRHGQTMESRRSDGPTSKHAPAPNTIPKANALHYEANLGAHSPSNFYKGLTGSDIIDHGGLFVATYKIPAVGTPLWIRVTMPGGYDFEASAVVSWTRESDTPESPPGFGAVFDKLSDQARQLVCRFTKNREPLLYDDL